MSDRSEISLLLMKQPFIILSLLQCLLFFNSRMLSKQENLPFENIKMEEGFTTIVQSIYQDRIGYLWFATWSGLYKYDGYVFTGFQHDFEDSNSIIDNTLNVVYEDKEGIIWVGSLLGLERFDPSINTFRHFTPNPNDSGDNKSNQVKAIHEDSNNMLWIGSGNGIYKFDRKSEEFLSIKIIGKSDLSPISIQSFYEDGKSKLWIGSDKGLYKFDLNASVFDTLASFTPEILERQKNENRKILRYWNFQSTLYKPENINSILQINSILGDETGIIWLGTNGGLVEYDPLKGISMNYSFNQDLPLNRISSISKDVSTGLIWCATIDGLHSFDANQKTFMRYNSKANFVLSERSGTLWIGTENEIKKLNRTKKPFKQYIIGEPVQTAVPGGKNIIWIFLNRGWLKFDVKKDQFVPYSFGENFLWYAWPNGGYCSIRGEKVGFYVIDTLDNTVFTLDTTYQDYINTLSIGVDCGGELWAGTNNGDVELWDQRTNQILEIKNFKRRISWIQKDSFGLLWVSCFKGNLYCYDQVSGTCKEYIYDSHMSTGLSGNIVYRMYEDSRKRLWFLTNNGLNLFNRSENSFTYFGKKNGFATNNTLGIHEDNNGFLWINTTRGITKFDPETKKIKNYDVSYGLDPAFDGSYGGVCRTKNGRMFFSGSNSINAFHPDSLMDNPFIPSIVITSFKKFDDHCPIEKEIRLPYDENFLSFEFAALSYVSQERNQYAYMMEGLDKDWVYSGTRRYASYPNLDPGEYVFRVKGSNNDGIWNETGAFISIIIAPPWWKTTWAYILYSLLILSIIYTTWKMQLKRIKISHEFEMTKFEAEKLHEVDTLKSRFFANISHEFRTPLTLILGMANQTIECVEDMRIKEKQKILRKNAKRLLGLVSQLLDISKLESGNMKLQTEPMNIVLLLKALTQSFASYAERKRITLNFYSAADEIIAYIDEDKIEKIITNILSNAFKFTPEAGKIIVSVEPTPESTTEERTIKKMSSSRLGEQGEGKDYDNNFVEIKISDTGVGIPREKLPKIFDRFYQVDGSHTREQEGTGIGLSLTKELVELHKGKIAVESDEGKGTTIRVFIPLGMEHLNPEEILEGENDAEVKEEAKAELYLPEQMNNLADRKLEMDIHSDSSKPVLILVEDNSDVRNYIKDHLETNYSIIEAKDGEEGWNRSVENIPDLIVSDIMMPKMDGFKLCSKLKTDERTSHIPVILLTAKAASSDKIEGFKIGADDYIMKPFEPEELKARIQNLIEQRKRLHEHFKKHGLIEIEKKNITSIDKKLLEKVFSLINEHIADTSLSVDLLTENLALSRSVLHRKMLSLIGETPGELIRTIRLKKAANLIENHFGNLSEIALEVGFNNPAYFSECFKKHFGISPSQYQQKFTLH